ncbi:UNVERIFIED_CONTAM: hypothetical protein FKN15_004245 [Acipenser sinensis]
MGRRKSCKTQQQQLPPGDIGPIYVVNEWCSGCGEFGHTVAISPTQYQGEEWEEPECPVPEWEEPELPVPEWEEPECPQPKRGKLVRPQPPEEISWEAFLRTVEASCWCHICGERGHSPLNCPLLPEGRLLLPVPPAEEDYLLVPPLWEDFMSLHLRQQRENTCWLCLHHRHQQREHACWFPHCSHKGRSPCGGWRSTAALA